MARVVSTASDGSTPVPVVRAAPVAPPLTRNVFADVYTNDDLLEVETTSRGKLIKTTEAMNDAATGKVTIVEHTANDQLVPNALNVLTGVITAMTLPPVSGWPGQAIIVNKDDIAGDVLISASGADEIAGDTSYTLSGNFGTVTFIASKTSAKAYPFPPPTV